jgi:FtsP/CotA-like multicopper oxidase with cupredoxin domain
VSKHFDAKRLSRRAILLGGVSAAGAYALRGRGAEQRVVGLGRTALTAQPAVDYHLAGTDGWAAMPSLAQGSKAVPPFWPDPMAPGSQNLYVFGFRDVTALNGDTNAIIGQKGKAQISAPQLEFDEWYPGMPLVKGDPNSGTRDGYRVRLSNLGLQVRPDLGDGHTMHWHGFVNAIPLFDGVPELSLSVPIGRDFTYFYRPEYPGTYMYHCHFEDVEHVQMGMTGTLYVRPRQNGDTTLYPSGRYAYNDGDGSTGYDREFGFLLSEVWVEGHYRDAHIQVSDWTDFDPSFWLMNGRSYPDTLAPNSYNPSATGRPWTNGNGLLDPRAGTEALQYQPQSSLVTCNAGERVLLRISSLGYQNHTMTVDGIDLTIVAKDATRLVKNGNQPNYLTTNSVEIGPGESRDVIFTAPDPGGTPPAGYWTYRLYDRNYRYASNAGAGGVGGMVTEIRVYPSGLGAQTHANDAVVWA